MENDHRRVGLARIYIREDDQRAGRRLYEDIVELACEMKIAGATVLRGVEGFGQSGSMHSSYALRATEDLPMVIEVIDSRHHLEPFIARVEKILEETGTGGLISLVDAEVFRPSVAKRLEAE